MTDCLTPSQRHHCMSHIRSKATKPEMAVRKWLWAHGYRYRLNVKSVPGKPDIVMRRYRTAIFVNGCFWHGHGVDFGRKVESSLMRVGEELKPMDDKTYISIIQEQEPDFSEEICKNAQISDLDDEAIAILKDKYAMKQKNPSFRTLSNEQALSDLGLLKEGKVTNAAVLLVGKENVIDRLFPQAKVMLEFRNHETQIGFDNRMAFGKPFYKMIDEVWNAINLRNGYVPVREGAYIGLSSIPFFNEDVIREVLNNAFAHRDYHRNSEIVIKMYPTRLDVINAGGFPQGVTLDNLLTVPSTPRNRLIADVMSKTGLVERSGQGMDKIFLFTLSEGKPAPACQQVLGPEHEIPLHTKKK